MITEIQKCVNEKILCKGVSTKINNKLIINHITIYKNII